jgi:isocitrate dehydrogenase
MYWADALAAQDKDAELKAIFTPIARNLNLTKRTITLS